MAKASNDERLVIRMPKELREWIDAQASDLGLDAATWVRMRLTQAMKGPAATAPVLFGAEPVAHSVPEPTQPIDPAVIDSLIGEGLAAADAQGLTQPAESTDDEGTAETVRLGAPSRATMRNLVGNGAPRPW